MSVLVECISVIVRRESLERTYPGGARGYEALCPNRTFCADEHLTRVGFMTPADVGMFCEHLERHGLVFFDGAQFVDIAVVDQHQGPTRPCDWLSFGKHVAGFTLAWLRGTSPGAMSAPVGWSIANTDRIHFAPDESGRLVPIGRDGKLDVFLDLATGKEVYVGRTDRS